MKYFRALFLTLACVPALTGCGPVADITITSGAYIMDIPEDSEALTAPCLTLDDTDGSMQLDSDYLSSYLCTGSYKISDGRLTAVTDDGKYTYIFEIIDENTLKFLQTESSEIINIDERSAVPAYDGALFRKVREME
ncbi:MAG: hypothetical protein IJ496_07760 [Ruminococcus sp.]|nr:hypothetical protein [Ruminococcus sp.]